MLKEQLALTERSKGDCDMANMQCQAATEKLIEIQQQISLKNAELAKISTIDTTNLKDTHYKLEVQLQDLADQRTVAEGELSTTEQKVAIAKDKLAQINVEREKMESDLSILQNKIEEYNNKALEKQHLLAQLGAKILEIGDKLQSTQEAHGAAEREFSQNKLLIEKQKVTMAQLEQRASEMHSHTSEYQSKLEQVKSELEITSKKLGYSKETLVQIASQVESKNTELRQAATALIDSRKTLEGVTSESEMAKLQLEKVKTELKKMAKAEFVNWEIVDMEKEMERRREDFQKFMREFSEKEKAASSKIAELDSAVSTKQKQIVDSDISCKSYEHQVSLLEQQVNQKRSEIDELKNESATLRNKLASQSDEYRQNLLSVDETKKQLTKLQQEVTELQNKRELLERQIQKAKDDSGKYLDICEISRLDLQKTKLENERLTKALQDLTFNISTKKLELDLLQSNLKSTTEANQIAQQKSDQLQTELREKERLSGRHEGDMGRQRIDMMDYLRKLEDLQANLRDKSRALERLNEQQNFQRESDGVSRFLQDELERMRHALEDTKAQALLDLQNLQQVYVAKDARRKAKLRKLKKAVTNLELEYHNHMELTQKQIILLSDSIKNEDIRHKFLQIGKIHKELSLLLTQKSLEAKKPTSRDLENSMKLAGLEKDAEISFLVSQLQKVQRETRDHEKASAQSQLLLAKLHHQLRLAENELHKNNITVPRSTSPPIPSSSPEDIRLHSPSPSPISNIAHKFGYIPTTPPIHQPFKINQSSPSPPLSTDIHSQFTLPTRSPSPSPFSQSISNTDQKPTSTTNIPPTHSRLKSPVPSNGYILAQIPPNSVSSPSHSSRSPSPPRTHTTLEQVQVSPPDKYELLERENANLREQCDSLTQKLYKSQQLFIHKLGELQGDKEELKSRLEKLEKPTTQQSSMVYHSLYSHPNPPVSATMQNIPSTLSFTSPTNNNNNNNNKNNNKNKPGYVTPEDWIFSLP